MRPSTLSEDVARGKGPGGRKADLGSSGLCPVDPSLASAWTLPVPAGTGRSQAQAWLNSGSREAARDRVNGEIRAQGSSSSTAARGVSWRHQTGVDTGPPKARDGVGEGSGAEWREVSKMVSGKMLRSKTIFWGAMESS